jgi:hypothetical protein
MSYESGSHWVLIFLQDQKQPPFFFDSLAKKPEEYNLLLQIFLIRHGPNYYMFTSRVQDYYTSSCGFFCLFVADLCSMGRSVYDISDRFKPSRLSYNETLVHEYVNGHMLAD